MNRIRKKNHFKKLPSRLASFFLVDRRAFWGANERAYYAESTGIISNAIICMEADRCPAQR